MILTSLLASDVETGYFATPFRIVEVLGGGVMIIVGSAFPVLARAASEDLERFAAVLQRLFDAGLVAGAWLALVTVAGAPFVIGVVAGPGFGPSVEVLQLFGLTLLSAFPTAAWTYALLALSAYRALLVINGAAIAAATAATMLLVPPMGARGAALAALTAEAVLIAGYLVALSRGRTVVRWSRRGAGRVAVAIALAAPVAVLPALPPPAALAVATLVYAAVVFAGGALAHELRALSAPLPNPTRRHG
jgi:O-antigen/teichoic acid export membrane protein